jgi:capsular polysaccharide export protein
MLQGPLGPFFRRLARTLTEAGAIVHKVNFNGGDLLFYPTAQYAFRGKMADWPGYLEDLLDQQQIDVIVLFGDCRPIHRVAREIAARRGIKLGVFEEGYIRPNYITFEQGGVNGYSLLGRSAETFKHLPRAPAVPEREIGRTFWHSALWAVLYYVAADMFRPLFRHYQHHRPLSIFEGLPWIRAAYRKWHYARKEASVQDMLSTVLSKRFFLVPLQIATDSQILQHSEFDTVAEFIRETVESFAAHAPAGTLLVIKHHPLDRGYHDYADLIEELAITWRVQKRVLYIHDQHLPTLFDHMRGAIVINSTVGFSALSHSGAVKTTGRAIYDMEGLTYQGSLNRFWAACDTFKPDRDLVERFRSYVIDETQINANFYKGDLNATVCLSMTEPLRTPRPVSAPIGYAVVR